MTTAAPSVPVTGQKDSGNYDYALRRQSRRSGREKGCWTYISAEELKVAGFDPDGPPPFYRVWGTRRGGVLVRLYKGR